MPKSLKPKAVVAFLESHGFSCVRQRGSHAIYRHTDGGWTVVPMHNRDLPHGTLRGICKRAGVRIEDL